MEKIFKSQKKFGFDSSEKTSTMETIQLKKIYSEYAASPDDIKSYFLLKPNGTANYIWELLILA